MEKYHNMASPIFDSQLFLLTRKIETEFSSLFTM